MGCCLQYIGVSCKIGQLQLSGALLNNAGMAEANPQASKQASMLVAESASESGSSEGFND